MDPQNSTTTTPTPSTPSQPPPAAEQPTPQSQPPPSQPLPPPSSSSTPIPPSPNPNPKPSPQLPPQSQSQSLPSPRPPPSSLTRPWPQSHFAHFPSSPSSASSVPPPAPSASTPPPPRGGIAIGVPAHHAGPSPPQPAPFSSSYGQHFGGLGRGGVSVPESVSNSNASQVRPSMQGMPGIGMMGSLGSGSQMRPGGVAVQHQQRPVQSTFRPPSTASSQPPSSQNFQGHSMLRVPPAGSASSSPNTSQGLQPHTQPWLSGSQGKPPIPSPSYRQQLNSPSIQQRSHVPQQQHHALSTASQQQHHPGPSASQQQHHPGPSISQQQHHPGPSVSQQQHHSSPSASQQQHHLPPSASQQQHHLPPSALQQQHHPPSSASQQQHHPMPLPSQQQHTASAQHLQPSSSLQGPEHFGQQVQPSRVPQTMPRQQQITRVQGLANQKSTSVAVVQPNTVQSGPQSKTASAEADESCNRILSKRSIHELVNQIDPSEKLDPEVEDILMDIADEFVESVTTFGCSLAKHRKSTTLEAKDILLHIEKNWNITLPGFAGDEIKGFRKPVTNDIHKERLAVIKKSIVATETANARNSTGQATGNAKGSLVKTPANIINSQNIKMREVT